MEGRLGNDWWTLPAGEIVRATGEIAASRGAPEHGGGLAEAAEGLCLTRLWVKRMDSAMPGWKRPPPREVGERIYIQMVKERHGRMTPLAARIGRECGLEI
jgi:hypothetical protein